MRLGLRTLVVVAVFAAGSLAACGDDDDDGDRAQNYALQVERISDDAYDAAQEGLVNLNKLSDGSAGAQQAIDALDRSSRVVTADRAELAGLAAPVGGAEIADDLAFQFDSLARSLDEAAATIRATGSDAAALQDTGRSFARVVLAYQSGSAALSRALRTSVVSAAED